MSLKRYKEILDEFKRKKILVVGDIILDRYIWGRVNRISPEAPVPIVEVSGENFLLGGAANVSHNIVSLGGKSTIVGIAGNDRPGEILTKLLEQKGIKNCVIYTSRPTTVKTRVIAHNQQVVRFDREDRGKLDGKNLSELKNKLIYEIQNHDAVIISDYKKGVVSLELVREIIKHAKPRKIFVAVDPKVGHFHLYKDVSLITPNIQEASQASGIEIKDDKTLIKAGKFLLKKIPCDAVLITRGEHGMSLFVNNKVVHVPTVAKNVYDVTGAGDTVIAVFTLSLVSGATMEEAAVISNHAAGIVVGEVGTAVTNRGSLLKSLKQNKINIEIV